MNSLPSIALSGLDAAMLRLSASANNIANSQTPGYRREFVMQASQDNGGVATRVGRANEAGSDLLQDIVDQTASTYSFKANLRVIQAYDEMMGSLLDVRA